MSRLIKFPSSVRPSRVTPNVMRVDKVNVSPVNNAQQVVARGSPAWRWTFEYSDISLEERDLVQAFLAGCEGSVNHFKVGDPTQYDGTRYVSSLYGDLYQGHGNFMTDAGSTATRVNSWFHHSSDYLSHVPLDGTAHFEIANRAVATLLAYRGDGLANGEIASLESNVAYCARVKFFQHPTGVPAGLALTVGQNSLANVHAGPCSPVYSSDAVSTVFVTGNTSDYVVSVQALPFATLTPRPWRIADATLSRCALVANSENMITQSNSFAAAIWSQFDLAIFTNGGPGPDDANQGRILLAGTGAGNKRLTRFVGKVASEGVYTFSIYAKAHSYSTIGLRMDDSGASNFVHGVYDLNFGTVLVTSEGGTFQNPRTNIFRADANSWWRCQLTGRVSNVSSVRVYVYVTSGTSVSYTPANGSGGVVVFGAQLVEHPFAKPYVATDADPVITSSAYQTGPHLVVDGLRPREVIHKNTRLEVVTRFHDSNLSTYERSEYKRVTETVRASAEGWAVLPVDPRIRNSPVPGRSMFHTSVSQGTELIHNPVIFHAPEMRARLIAGTVQESEKPLQLYDVSFDVLEDLAQP